MDAITVNAIIEMPSYTTAAVVGTPSVETKNTNIYLGGKFALSSTDAVKAAFTKRGASKVGSVSGTDGATQLSIGYDHSMSKATSVYASYTKTTGDTGYSSLTPAATAAYTASLGQDPSVISFGMKHSF